MYKIKITYVGFIFYYNRSTIGGLEVKKVKNHCSTQNIIINAL